MRNLKRALSLALASVMLLGMMVVGSSAAFADDAKIVNDEAVGIAAGLGLFAGYEENGVTNFKPEETVTRAQMAAIIAKMFYGSELNADTYKGGNKFTDTANFEGGWAEGYINLGVEKGWFKGYGDGTFKPGQAVTTAEAMTMIINLLKIDAGEGTWPMTVMAAVEEAKLFNDKVELKPAPATNAAMNRDQLSVAIVNGLWYSAEGVQGYAVKGSDLTFKTWSDAAEYYRSLKGLAATATVPSDAIAEVKGDTLADTVFQVVEFDGVITENQATGADYTVVGGKKLNIETGLDMLGHKVTALYAKDGEYKTEKNPGTAYGVIDLADYFTVENDIFEDKKAYTAVFGSKVELGTVAAYTADGKATTFAANYDEDDFTADAGIYGVDKESGKIITYIAPAVVTIEQVGVVKTVAGKESIKVGNTIYNNNEDEDVIVEYEGVAEDDIVAVKKFRDMTYIEKIEPVEGKIESVKNAKLNGKTVKYVTIGGKDYLDANFTIIGNANAEIPTTSGYKAHKTNTYAAYVYGGKLIGVDMVSGAGNLEDAIFVVKCYDADVASGYGQTVKHYYAQGVNAKGEEVTTLIGIDGVSEDNGATGVVTSLTVNTFYTFDKSLDREQAKKDIMTATKALTAANVATATDGFFGQAADMPANSKLEKDTKYLTYGGKTSASNRLYLTENTKFMVIENPGTTVDELEMAVYTGPIAKNLTGDKIFVAGTADANGSKAADIVVIMTAKVNLAVEDYVYIAKDAVYSQTADGFKFESIYFTETEEFKTGIVADKAYANGFYEIDEIDEDGVYTLVKAPYAGLEMLGMTAKGVYGNSLIINTADEGMYALGTDAKIFDVRSEETLEKSEVGEITSLKDIQSAIKGTDPYTVTFDLLLEDIDASTRVITHIFVKSISKAGSEI